jgi:transposase, IS30 family
MQKKKLRKSRKLTTNKRCTIPDIICIYERLKQVEDRIIPGYWEGELIAGNDNKSPIGFIVERT